METVTDVTGEAVVHVQLRVDPTPGWYFKRNIHAAGFVEGRDACEECNTPRRVEVSFAMRVFDLSSPSLAVLETASVQDGIHMLPYSLRYESDLDYGDLIDSGKFPKWKGDHWFPGGTLEEFRATRTEYFTQGWEVYGGQNQRLYTPAGFLNRMAARNAAGGWHLAPASRQRLG
ncbi:hypothetical protein [Cryobacterium sp. Y29]|uniref:hypothetical protein n=1 Tax=Cryobacterium sp. Y29 TaxID=2048285 RepID=UPI000CE44569|nr:hypothetical protein [Cryobacterium sp. Y29]